MSDELASDSDDEKRIRRAEAAAHQKKERKMEYGGKQNPRTQFGNWNSSAKNNSFFRTNSLFSLQSDICFSCGLAGHRRKFYTNNSYSQAANTQQAQF